MESVALFGVLPLVEPENSEACLENVPSDSDFHRQVTADFKRAGLDIESIECVKSYNNWCKYSKNRDRIINREPQDPDFKLNETYLYHGTSADKSTICEEGFDATLESEGSFGKGIYFSDTPMKCKDYTPKNTILVARVILGESKKFETGKKSPLLLREPEKTGAFKGWRRYDSVTGCPDDFTEYVVYTVENVLLEYIVKFIKADDDSQAASPGPQVANTIPQDASETQDTAPGQRIMESVALFGVLPLVEPEKSEAYLENVPNDSDFHRQITADFKRAGLDIESIESVKSYNNWNRYNDKKNQIENRIPQDPDFKLNETYLYHGTSTDKSKMCEEGFDVNLASDGCFGKGIYFSDTPMKCKNYTKKNTILVARVILGESKIFEDGKKCRNMKNEPAKTGDFKGCKKYDSVKGCPKNFMEYVIYRSELALVECIVTFKKADDDSQAPLNTIPEDESETQDTDAKEKEQPDSDSSDSYEDAQDDNSYSSSSSDEECHKQDKQDNNSKSESSDDEVEKVSEPMQSVIPYFKIKEGDLTLDEKKAEYKRITQEKDGNEVDSMLKKTDKDLERAVYLFYAYKQVREDEAKRQAGEFVEDVLFEDDGSPIFPPMDPAYESESWNKLSENDKKAKMDKMIEDFLSFTALEEVYHQIALNYVTNAKYNLDAAVVEYYKSWF